MDRALDVAIAERVMGYHDIRRARHGTLMAHVSEERQDSRICVGSFSSDLNHCARAERRIIELGLREKYAEALENLLSLVLLDELSGRHGPQVEYGDLATLLTAPADARCRAMLSVLEEG